MLKTFGLFQELNQYCFLLFVGWITGQGKRLQCLQCFDSSSGLAMRKSSSMDLQYLTKGLRGNLRELGPVCSVEEHEGLPNDILEKTPRLNKEEATKSVKKRFLLQRQMPKPLLLPA